MKARTGTEMRELDRKAIEYCGIPGIFLMEQAGKAVAFYAEQLAKPFSFPDFILLAGKGNNGGDALIAARLLSGKGYPCKVFLTCHPDEITGDAAEAFRRLPEHLKQNIRTALRKEDFSPESVVIDGILGTGVSGSPRPPADHWIGLVNDSGQPVLAIDLPSGLDSETGEAECCIRADMTVTLAMYKRGMFYGKGPALCGVTHLAPIGFPKILLEEETAGDTELFTEYDFRRYYKKERPDIHKNCRGTLLVAGGSKEYPGAPCLAAVSGLRGGAGIVMLLSPESVSVNHLPHAVIHRKVPDLGRGIWTADALESVAAATEKADAAVFGPGVGTHPESLNVLKYLLRTKLPLVLDADGLNLLAEHPHIAGLLHHNVILTPHPGEIKRLQNAFSLPGTESRQEQAYSLSLYTGAVTVLKGQHSVVAAPDGTVTLNTSGSAALAAAGSGDCLAGLCGAFLANGYTPSAAARMAVFLHGKAGERAAVSGVRGIIADDLPDYFTIDGVFV